MNFLTWRAGSDKHTDSDHVTWLADIGSSLGSLIYTPAQSVRWRRFPSINAAHGDRVTSPLKGENDLKQV
jgi:hypothetical protein